VLETDSTTQETTMTQELMTASDLLSNAIASLKDAHHKAAHGDDQFGEIVMRDLLEQARELRQRLTEVMMAADCPTI
jgi:hypothetical protein